MRKEEGKLRGIENTRETIMRKKKGKAERKQTGGRKKKEGKWDTERKTKEKMEGGKR